MHERSLTPELMDDPTLREEEHTRALHGLSRLNRFSLASAPIAQAIRQRVSPGNLTILDVASGSGDVAHAVYRKLRDRYVCQFFLADISPHALRIAQARFADTPVETYCIDAIHDSLPTADVIVCSLFLHHLTDHDCVQLLRSMSASTRRLIVISDLRRSTYGTTLARIVPKLLSTSPIVHTDALKSARAAFTVPELQSIATKAQLANIQITRILPSRLLLTSEPMS